MVDDQKKISSVAPVDDSGFNFTPDAEDEMEDFSLRMETDPLLVPGALEVEESPSGLVREGEGLQSDATTSQIRNATGSVLLQSEVLDVQNESAMGLKELLAEANLGERHLRFCAFALLGGLIVLGVLAYVWLADPAEKVVKTTKTESSWIVSQWTALQTNVQEKVENFEWPWASKTELDTKVQEPKSKVSQSIVVGSDLWVSEEDFQEDAVLVDGRSNNLLEMGVLLGAPIEGDSQELTESASLGTPGDLQDPLAEAIKYWGEAKQLMDLDVQSFVLQSSDPRDALNSYVKNLEKSMFELRNVRVRLQQETEALAKQFAILEKSKEEAEQAYFVAVQESYGALAVNHLQSFIQKGEAIVSLRAHYLARVRLAQSIDRALPLMELRLQDVDANTEAIIRGIKIYDFSRSDLRLILDGDSL